MANRGVFCWLERGSATSVPVIAGGVRPSAASRLRAYYAVAFDGGCSRTVGRYSTSWIRSSRVLLVIMSSATSG